MPSCCCFVSGSQHQLEGADYAAQRAQRGVADEEVAVLDALGQRGLHWQARIKKGYRKNTQHPSINRLMRLHFTLATNTNAQNCQKNFYDMPMLQ